MDIVYLILALSCLIGMAKVTGPLFSISASGKIADAMVYFGWKGINVVRSWVKPANPESGDQGDRRVMLGGLGRAPKYVQAEKVYYNHAIAVAVAPDTWISAIVGYIMATYFVNVAGYQALYDEFDTHGQAAHWVSEALALGLTTFDIAYKDMPTPFHHGFQLYCLAKYACDQYLLNNLKFATAPYTKALNTWDDADIDLMVADFTA